MAVVNAAFKKIEPSKIAYGLIVSSILALSFFIPKYGSYFFFKGYLQKNGIFKLLLFFYQFWDGRNLSVPGLIQASFIKFLPHTAIIFAYSLIFLFSSYLCSIILNRQVGSREDNYAFISFATLTYFYGFYTHIRETVFYAVAGWYISMALLLIIWLLIAEKSIMKSSKKLFSVLFVLFSFIVADLSQNILLAVFIFLCYTILKHKNKVNRITAILSVLSMFLGFFMIAQTPGNAQQIAFYGAKYFCFSAVPLLKNFISISFQYISFSWILILLSSFLGLFNSFSGENNKEAMPHLTIFEILTRQSIWLVLAFSTIVPMALIPKEATPRTSIFFMIFISFFLHNFFYYLSRNYKDSISLKKVVRFMGAYGLFFIVSLHLFVIYKEMNIGLNAVANQKYNEAEIIRQKNGGSKVIKIKEKITSKGGFAINCNAIPLSSNPEFWVNRHLAAYYGVDSISAN